VARYIDRMGCQDVIIKSGSVLDPEGNAGCIVASPDGGEIGAYLPHILARGIQLIVPMTLNKTVAYPLKRLISAVGISKLEEERCHGLLIGMMPMPGIVITEVEAILHLTGAEAVPIAVNGIGSGAGAVVLAVNGSAEEVEKAWDLVEGIKRNGERPLAEPLSPCDDCYILQNPSIGVRCGTMRQSTE